MKICSIANDSCYTEDGFYCIEFTSDLEEGCVRQPPFQTLKQDSQDPAEMGVGQDGLRGGSHPSPRGQKGGAGREDGGR